MSDVMERRRFGAWVRYGDPLTRDQLEFAAAHYRVAILQPWEVDAAAYLKRESPDMTVLCYKCLSSTRDYEPGPVYTSGLSFAEAESMGEAVFAHRPDGSRIEWRGYPGHWQMAVWNADYRRRWVANVVAELAGSPWDGVMADNDVFDDYYGLTPPLDGGYGLPEIRRALDALVTEAGPALNAVGKILVPNIAESRRDPGKWERHSAYGGGFEEVWLAYGPENCFDLDTVLAQATQPAGPGVTVMRVASDGTNEHRNFRYGLAAFWIFGGGEGTAYTATGHDQYSSTPYIPELGCDLGRPVERIKRRGNGRFRGFSNGWAAANFNSRLGADVTFRVPNGLCDVHGAPAPRRVTLAPHEGVVYVRERPEPSTGAA
jgi:hypothetical protein